MKIFGQKKVDIVKVHDLLINEDKIIGAKGKIMFNLKNINITIKTKDVVGNIIQDWFGEWLKLHDFQFAIPDNSQNFPDFYLNITDVKKELLEVKAFDLERGANFDIANFEAYCNSLSESFYRIDADYLIFGYIMDENSGEITIKNIWLKKIWEIAGNSGAYPLKIQQKRGMIYNIRPINWYASNGSKYQGFESKKEFIHAIYGTLSKYSKTKKSADKWFESIKKQYKEHTGKNIS